jgi:hypothetical protein
MRPYAAIIGTAVAFGAVGVLATFWPYTIQRWALSSQGTVLARLNPFRGLIASDSYVPVIRGVGIMALGVAVLALVRLMPDAWLAW